MKKTRFKPPYNKKGNTNFRFTNNKAGVYLVKNKDGKIVYIGMSASNLYKTMYRHFQSWKDSTQIRIVYPKQGYTVRVVLTTSKRAYLLERALILKMKPKDNPHKLELFTATNKEKTVLKEYETKSDWFEERTDTPF